MDILGQRSPCWTEYTCPISFAILAAFERFQAKKDNQQRWETRTNRTSTSNLRWHHDQNDDGIRWLLFIGVKIILWWKRNFQTSLLITTRNLLEFYRVREKTFLLESAGVLRPVIGRPWKVEVEELPGKLKNLHDVHFSSIGVLSFN